NAGRCHPDIQAEVGDDWLLIHTPASNMTRVQWNEKALVVKQHRERQYELWLELRDKNPGQWGVRTGTTWRLPFVPASADHEGFVDAAEGRLTVLIDPSGEVAVFNSGGNLICMFFVFRNQFAAWRPDGTRYGPASLTGGPPTPDALERLARALQEASGSRRAAP